MAAMILHYCCSFYLRLCGERVPVIIITTTGGGSKQKKIKEKSVRQSAGLLTEVLRKQNATDFFKLLEVSGTQKVNKK